MILEVILQTQCGNHFVDVSYPVYDTAYTETKELAA